MKNFKTASKETTLFFCLLLISFLFVLFRFTAAFKGVKVFFLTCVAPSYEVPAEMMHGVSGVGGNLIQLVSVYQDNRILKEKMGQYSILEAQKNDLDLENQRLRKILNLAEKKSFKSISAIVYGRDVRNGVDSFWINAGESKGVQSDDSVLGLSGNVLVGGVMHGVIGRVLECEDDLSKVLLISDPLSSVSCTVPRSSEQGLLQGQGGYKVTLEYLSPTADVQEGDQIVTSGLGGIFPDGLVVGKVVKVIALSSGFKKAEVAPFVSLSSIKEVMVLKPETLSAEAKYSSALQSVSSSTVVAEK